MVHSEPNPMLLRVFTIRSEPCSVTLKVPFQSHFLRHFLLPLPSLPLLLPLLPLPFLRQTACILPFLRLLLLPLRDCCCWKWRKEGRRNKSSDSMRVSLPNVDAALFRHMLVSADDADWCPTVLRWLFSLPLLISLPPKFWNFGGPNGGGNNQCNTVSQR